MDWIGNEHLTDLWGGMALAKSLWSSVWTKFANSAMEQKKPTTLLAWKNLLQDEFQSLWPEKLHNIYVWHLWFYFYSMVTFLLGPRLARRLSKRRNFKGRNKLKQMKGHCLRSTQVFMGCSHVQNKAKLDKGPHLRSTRYFYWKFNWFRSGVS